MAKINKDYQSLYHYLLDALFPKSLSSSVLNPKTGSRHIRYRLPFQERVFQENVEKNKNTSKRFKPYRNFPSSLDLEEPMDAETLQLLGAFQPLFDMKKDWVDSFKPYKTKMHILRDLAQPIYGVGNMIKALLTIGLAPLVFIGENMAYPFIEHKKADYSAFLYKSFTRFISWIVDAFTSAVRGATQLAFTPFLLFKIPYRVSLGTAKIEDNPGLRLVVDKAVDLASDSAVAERARFLMTGKAYKAPSVIGLNPSSQHKLDKVATFMEEGKKKAAKLKANGKKVVNDVIQIGSELLDDILNEASPAPNLLPIIFDEGRKKVEPDTSMKAETLVRTYYEIHRKAKKSFDRGQQSYDNGRLNREKECEYFTKIFMPSSESDFRKTINPYADLFKQPGTKLKA